MDSSNIEVDYNQLPVPEGIDVPRLQYHFIEKYELDTTQAELLVFSSCESLREVLAEANDILATSGAELDYERIRGIVHRAKGLFLIMGMENWAQYVTNLKKSGQNRVYDNLQIVVVNIQKNFSDIIVLCG